MNKKTLLYILLIILTVGIYYYQRDDSTVTRIEIEDISSQPIYQSQNMETTIYDPFGNLSYKIMANHVQHFDNTGETLFQSPNITLYNPDGEITWHISSQKATFTQDKLLYLNDSVILKNLLDGSQLQKIMTDNAKINLTTQIVTSDDDVIIEGPSFTSTGTGLLGNLREKTADILQNVKTHYSASNLSQDNPTN